jgi:methylenetetrahydrofolate reductase (NADPH)
MSAATVPMPSHVRFETLPFASLDTEVAAVPHPVTLTVTCSPRHGIDHSVTVAAGLRTHGHVVIVHLAARMIRSAEHLDDLLTRLHEADIHDVFLVGGDQTEPLGPYRRSADLLPVLRSHALAPRTIGVTAYPEGHPSIPDDVLRDDLSEKAALADYATTQMCFHPPALLGWLQETRAAGIEIPIYVGLPGVVDRRRLLEISLKVGVGNSVSYLRKQHGIGRLAGNGKHVAQRLYDEVAPLVGGPLGIAGLHLFTFNRLADTIRLVDTHSASIINHDVCEQLV